MGKRQNYGVWLWATVIMLVVVLFCYVAEEIQYRNDYSYNQMRMDLENDLIESAQIRQNKQVPTGQVIVWLKDGEEKDMYVTDVGTAVAWFEQYGVTCEVLDVPQESQFMTVFVPILTLALLAFLVIFVVRVSVGGNGGGNTARKAVSGNVTLVRGSVKGSACSKAGVSDDTACELIT